jgi:hypothetical protein
MTIAEAAHVGKVLIIGDREDPTTEVLNQHCKDAGCLVTLYTDYQIYDLQLETPQDIIFYNYPVHCLSEQVFARDLVRPHSIIYLSAYSDWALGKLLPEHEGQVLAYSPLGLLGDRKMVELGVTLKTSEVTLERGKIFLENMGLKVSYQPEMPGFVFPRILAMLVNEAVSALMEGVASPEDIDIAMKLGTNYPLGPLAWADEIGLDVILEILENLHHQYGEPRYRPMSLLSQKVMAGHTGKKAGEGFFTYVKAPRDTDSQPTPV